MRFVGFIGPSYKLQSVNADCQRCINLYPEINELGTGKEGDVACLVGTPGLSLLVTLPTSPVRGIYTDSSGNLWAVGGNKLYSISSAYVATEVGLLSSLVGPVDFADNGTQVVLVDGNYGYFWSIEDSSDFQRITDESFYGSNRVAFFDGYFVFNRPNTQQFYLSPLNTVLPFDGTDIASAEAGPEDLLGHVVMQENLYLFSKNHLEVWYNSGNSSFPMERIQGSVLELGCASAQSVVSIQSSVFWLGKDKTGQGKVYQMSGLQPQRVSTLAIETKIQELGENMSTARAWAYQQGGHIFYCLNIPNDNTTWCYDLATGMWHERAYFSSVNGYSRHLADCCTFAFSKNIVGDYSSGNIYSLEPTVYTDNGNYISRERISPHLAKDIKRIFYSQFQLDMEMGLGLDGSGQGVDPQVMLSWSNDGGHSYSNEHWVSASRIGTRKARAIFRRLGQARDRVFKVRMTDPIKVTWLGADLQMEQGAS